MFTKSRLAMLSALLFAAPAMSQGTVPAGGCIGPIANPFPDPVLWQTAIPQDDGSFLQTGLGVVPVGGNFKLDIPADPALCGTTFRLCFVQLSTPPVNLGCSTWTIEC